MTKSGRSFNVNSNGVLERMIQKNLVAVNDGYEDEKTMKIIMSKHSADSIRSKMMHTGKHTTVEAFTSMCLRDHMGGQNKHYPHERDDMYKSKSYNIKKWV